VKKAIVVLGMHRSGTSSVAGTLATLGASAPRTLMPEHPTDNPKGYWESLPIVQMNDKILNSAKSSWRDWMPFAEGWRDTAQGQEQITELVQTIEAEFGDAAQIVLKDPRICRLFPLWKAALQQAGYSPAVVIPLRHPLEVAASLSKRDGLSTSEGMMLWLRHVLDAERDTRGAARAFVSWEGFIQNWQSEAQRLSDHLDLGLFPAEQALVEAANALVDPSLKRNTVEDSLSNQAEHPALKAYRILLTLTTGDPLTTQLDQLDALGEDLNLAMAFFGDLSVDLRDRVEAERTGLLALKIHLANERARSHKKNLEIASLKTSIKGHEIANQAMEKSLIQQKSLVATLSRRIMDQANVAQSLAERLKGIKRFPDKSGGEP
jgi:hypothetical protein